MMTTPQPGSHLDADQLAAFAEGALSTSERALCLQHLAACAHCREVVFLANSSLLCEGPIPEPVHKLHRSWWSAWWPAVYFGAAALAAVIIAVVLLHRRPQRAQPEPVQIATESTAPPPGPPTAEVPASQPTTETPRAHAAPKPSPAQKAASKPETPVSAKQPLNDAVALDSMTAPAQPVAGASLALPAPASKSLHGAAGAVGGPLLQPPQTQAAEKPKAAPDVTLRAYSSAAALRSTNGLAEIAGTITDRSGATIPHARVSLDPTSGTAHRETLTDAAGRFTISSLQPGEYHIEISSPGFMTQVREIELGTSQLARVDSQLPVGSAAETVTVEAAGSALKTESMSTQSTLPNKEPVQTSVSSGTRTLALDATGKLFLSKKSGNHWKVVHGPWKRSAVTDLSVAPDQSFQVTTAQGSWMSSDGEHWHSAN